MATTKIAAILRAGAFSPNHVGNDATIMNAVAEQLRKRGCEVNIYSEEQFATGLISEPVIINMCREKRSTELLQKLEDEGALVINSGYGNRELHPRTPGTHSAGEQHPLPRKHHCRHRRGGQDPAGTPGDAAVLD